MACEPTVRSGRVNDERKQGNQKFQFPPGSLDQVMSSLRESVSLFLKYLWSITSLVVTPSKGIVIVQIMSQLLSLLILFHCFLCSSASPFLPIIQHARKQFLPFPENLSRQQLTKQRPRMRCSPYTAFADPAEFFAAIGTFYKNSPLASAFVTCAIKGSAADFVAQSKTQRVSHGGSIGLAPMQFQLKRNLAFLLYGGIYQGLGFEFFYNILFPKLFGDSIAKKVFASMFVLTPCVTLPLAYLFKAMVLQDSLQNALNQYKSDVMEKGLLSKYWLMWIPLQTLSFAVVPQHFRISFIAAFSFFWMILFSIISSRN